MYQLDLCSTVVLLAIVTRPEFWQVLDRLLGRVRSLRVREVRVSLDRRPESER